MTINQLVDISINKLNANEDLKEFFEDLKAGCLHKIVERRLLKDGEMTFPNLELIHPSDISGLPDIYSKKYNKGLEIKCTFGWPTYSKRKINSKKINVRISDDKNVQWTNGTPQINRENFLFIKLGIKNGLLVAERIYYGNISYKDDWKIHTSNSKIDLRISEKMVKNKCKQLR